MANGILFANHLLAEWTGRELNDDDLLKVMQVIAASPEFPALFKKAADEALNH